ncbi:Asp-tRNA(Asn)/Glu-tRNA(Gln) amidotransferase GatCAB subunit B [Candidatus Peregrinibacteria bacterium CG_4_9_14_0_2_um_filter_53_11]|nr:MAG: Asp-tRNA(Asn)/Glu-tRNA(Gln) amidotransferase GatCAB subunit B [Candidatus Peregrinibacteria bacterium CG_4_9_14_0_2_um_filter_53_11]
MLHAYEVVIGLEIHAQISSKTKMFCSCSTDSFGKPPNSNVCPICMGFPGMLPATNKECVEKGIRAALALNCEIPSFSKFDRKNYFYPDLPKGYQISQFDQAVSGKGFIEVEGGRRIGITRLHLEDDAGKLTHTSRGTLCDYNRSGAPLMEIVSEPDMRSVAEASAYAQEVRRILRYVGSSDCDMEKGMMRFDLNVSLRPVGQDEFGTKVEVKNLNSFRSLERALEYEIRRQEEMLENGQKIAQETRGWDDDKAETVSQRGKEQAHDYRYFPEPDLPPVEVEESRVLEYKKELPELPRLRRARFVSEYGLSEHDALFLAEEPERADYFEEVIRVSGDMKKAASFVTTILFGALKRDQRSLSESPISARQLGTLVKRIVEGKLSTNQAKGEVFEAMYSTGKDPDAVIDELGLSVVSDAGAIDELCKKVIEAHPGPVADVQGGKEQAIGFLVGQVMKESRGTAQPPVVQERLRALLGL